MRWFAVFLVLVVLGLLVGMYWFLHRVPTGQLSDAEQRAGDATVGQGRAQASNDALRIVQRGQERERRLDSIKEQAHAEIDAAAGADERLDPGLRNAVNRVLREPGPGPDDPGQLPVFGQHP